VKLELVKLGNFELVKSFMITANFQLLIVNFMVVKYALLLDGTEKMIMI
jgi:hypothetical protein